MKPLSVIYNARIWLAGKLLLLFFYLFLFIDEPASAQRLSVKFSPLSLLDPGTATAMVGAETRVGRRWAFELDYGVKTNTGVFHWNVNKSRYHYFKLRSEIKYFPFQKKRVYAGIAFFYVPQSYDNAGDTYEYRSTKYRYDKAHIAKNVYGICLKAGYVAKISQRFSAEFFGGLGVRFVAMEFTHVEGKTDITPGLTEWFSKEDIEGLQTLLHLEIGVKINMMIIR
jgi:hypothetical protein